jgi:hypothetical protein
MAKKRRSGYSFVGKEVQSSEFRVDKDFYVESTKASSQGKVNGLDVNQEGKMIISPKAIAGVAIDDDNVAIDARDLEAGILTITPTANRIKATPTAATIISQFGFTEYYQNADIPILNLATANYSLTLSAGTDVTLVGDVRIAPNSTGLFRFVVSNADVDEITIYRIAGSDSTTVDSLLAGNGIDLSDSTGNITVSAEDASATNPGIVELATTAEADTGTDTARAVTPAGLKSHVDARYHYQYIALSANASTPSDSDWMYASGNGIGNHTYNSNGAAGGVTPHNTDGSASTITIGKNTVSGGIIVPYASVLVGFTAQTRSNADKQQAVGIFTGTPDWNDYDDITAYLRGYSAQDISAGPDTSYSVRPVYHSVLDVNYTLAAGECLWFALKDLSGSGGGCIASATIVLKTLIP